MTCGEVIFLTAPSHSWINGRHILSFKLAIARASIWIVISVALCLVAHGECRPISPDVRAALNSPRWQVRRDAFERIAGAASGAPCATIRRALIRLRDREDHASEFSPVDLFEDDDYNAYNDQLTRLVQKIAVGTNEPTAWRSLVNMRYNGDSPFGQWLAKQKEALPLLIGQLKSPYSVRRMSAVEVISLRLYYSKSAKPDSDTYVSPDRYIYLKDRIRFVARTDAAPVSQAACMGMGVIGDKSDIPLLEQIATSPKRDRYTQKFARQAIEQIRGDEHTVDRLRTQNSVK